MTILGLIAHISNVYGCSLPSAQTLVADGTFATEVAARQMLGKLAKGGALVKTEDGGFQLTGEDYVSPPQKPRTPKPPAEAPEDEAPAERPPAEWWLRNDGTLNITDDDGHSVSLKPQQSKMLNRFLNGMLIIEDDNPDSGAPGMTVRPGMRDGEDSLPTNVGRS